MIGRDQLEQARKLTRDYLAKAGIALTADESANIEVADCGLGMLETIGLQVVTYVNTDRVCAKELVQFPGQTFPEHRHPPVAGEPGKEETFRCRWGSIYLYVPGEPAQKPACEAPAGREGTFTVWHEVALKPGEQYTLYPNTPHWFQAGPEGCVVSEFSTRSRDESDVFTDASIDRIPRVGP